MQVPNTNVPYKESTLLYFCIVKLKMNIMKICNFLVSIAIMSVAPAALSAQKGPEWLNEAIFYQIYPSSYMDTDGNGIGDIPGIISRLDYIRSLGVTALWLNPVFESGWFDGGYDVIDYYKVDPRFGTNTDMVKLIDEAHVRGMKVCLDLVPGHTSTECAWFKESSQKDPNLRYSDYYIWMDDISEAEKNEIKERHKEPNPESSRRGRYVEANAPRAKYYEKDFFECQPALNYGFAHPDPAHPWEQPVDASGPQALRRELRNIMSFWFDHGVDGFRVDMANSLIKNDYDGVEIRRLWAEMRKWRDEVYPQCALISEWSIPTEAIPAGFDIDFMIHFGVDAYRPLFFAKDSPMGHDANYDYCYFDETGKGSIETFVKNYTEAYNATHDRGYIAIPTANHDFQRPNVGRRNTVEQLKVAMTFFLTMPGVPFIYYGDEIAMKYQPGLPSKEGSNDRAGTRTPMQWAFGATAGFSTCEPEHLYFPVDTDYGKLTVEAQEKDPNSMLNYVRSLIKLRKSSAALGNNGGWELLSSVEQPYPMIYKRALGAETYVVALNPSAKKVAASFGTLGFDKVKTVSSSGKGSYKPGKKQDAVSLGGFSAVVFKIGE